MLLLPTDFSKSPELERTSEQKIQIDLVWVNTKGLNKHKKEVVNERKTISQGELLFEGFRL